ncbi:putative 4-coumarate--CoA ligase 2 [Psilocybe cubensis]|uniref:4-coumarate--CoA ligase 2 n=2 Tax=Psilocybe cubensis TaxID=181762 RepID=A0ACB8GYG6_PSICU|nr:putative 4-coumarate--CoA ligase 2 [Psilocybe cubensis]KAH9480790.1 putative 4-coumarate--CoA ligase 2 [Psilocybe cubensis]
MYIKSPFPDPPQLPAVNAHYMFFKRPDQAEWPNYTVHIDPIDSLTAVGVTTAATAVNPTGRLMYRDYLRNIEDLSTGLGVSEAEGGLGLQGWKETDRAESVNAKAGREIIGIISENSSDYITLIHACIRIAVPFALISSYSTPFELKHALKLSKATRLFVDEAFLSNVLPVVKEVGLSTDRVYLLKEASGVPAKEKRGKTRKTFRSIIEGVRRRGTKTIDVRTAGKNTLAYLVFSSGTSGLPKAVMISHGNLIYSLGQAIVTGQAVAEVHTPPPPLNPEGIPVTLAFLPLHHTYGLHSYCFRATLMPSTLVILPKWNVKVALDAIPRYKVSSLPLIPSVVHQLANYPGIENADFSSVVAMNSGAAYLPPELGQKLTKLVKVDLDLMEGYGMSEATIAAIVQPYTGMLNGKLKRISGCTGVLLPGMEARVLRSEDAVPPPSPDTVIPDDCEVDEPGELWLRSPNVAVGYWNNPKANRETFVGGWLRTGDRFRVDKDGNFWFADRAKDTLKVSGAQVSPVEIEGCLLAHPGKLITDATVAGVSGGRTSDEKVPRAWVVLSPDASASLGLAPDTGKAVVAEKAIAELDRWHKENLSKYKWLRGGIEIVDEIPKSPTGKVLRRVLQDRYEQELKKPKKGKGKTKAKAKL